MLDKRLKRINGVKFALFAGIVALGAIAFLTFNVTREIRLLSSTQTYHMQWTLFQTQVEFFDFESEINQEPIDLALVREHYDLFFRRISLLRESPAFEQLLSDPEMSAEMQVLGTFLDETAMIIHATDVELLRQIPLFSQLVQDTGIVVRELGSSGVARFAQLADAQRQAVASKMTELAAAIITLIGALLIGIIYLDRLNRRNVRRESENQQTSKRMATVLGTSLDGVIMCNTNGIIIEFNPAAESIFGYREEEVLGKDIGSVIVPDHFRDAHNVGMKRMREKGEKRVVGKGRVKLEAVDRTGRVFPVELAIQSAETNEGEIFIAFLRDISRRVEAEAELVAARDKALASEQLKTNFLTTMSHEIRTPLNGLLGNLTLLRGTELNPGQDRYIKLMETSGRLLLRHISDVLDITRYDAGKLNTNSEPVNIAALLQDIVDSENGRAAANATSLTWRWVGEPIDWVLSDYDRLQHGLINIIGNAVKFTKRGDVLVTIEKFGSPRADKLVIKVKDTGPGMSEELALQVFDDFVTGNNAYDREVGGTGLGLSIAKRFVHSLGGEIGVQSKIGQGSTFWVSIPISETTAPLSDVKPDLEHVPIRSLKILLVEDNEINRAVSREMLISDGHQVFEAHDGKQAVDRSTTTKFDLILMDINMPVMDGRAATRAIRAGGGLSQKATIVAVTANAILEEQAKYLADGMNNILTKPLARDALRALLSHTANVLDETNLPMINLAHSTETREALGEEKFFKLQARFEAEVDELCEWLSSEKTLDFPDIAMRAHKVTGSSAVFGADQLRETLNKIEVAAKMENMHEIETEKRRLEIVWQHTKLQLGTRPENAQITK